MDKPNLIPSLKLILAAFAGGMVLSLLELMNMARAHENIADPYFFLGMFIAGLLGIVGLVISRSKDLGGAVTAGISAPQILAGITKAGAVTSTVFFSIIAPPVYAQDSSEVIDSVTITIIAETDRPLSVRPVNAKGGYFLTDSLKITVAKKEGLVFSGENAYTETLNLENVNEEITVRAKILAPVQQKSKGLLRGLFAQQVADPNPNPAHIELEIMKEKVIEK